MSDLRTLRQRVRSVENTRKITKAMQMVSGAKLRRLQEEFLGFKPYADGLKLMGERFLASFPDFQHPLLESSVIARRPQGPTKQSQSEMASSAKDRFAMTTPPVGLLVVTSNTGLCGTYNDRTIALAEGFLREHPRNQLIALGKKGSRYFARRGISPLKEILDWSGRLEAERAARLLAWLTELFLAQKVSCLWVAYTQFLSALRFKPVVVRLLPLTRPVAPALPERLLTEPSSLALGDRLLRRGLEVAFQEILLSALTAEHSARMIAMKNATDNASEMIDLLTLLRNKARQAAITKELIEVVSGAEALR